MNISSEVINGILVATLNERRLDAALAVRFKDTMRPIVETAEGRVVLNLEHVEFMDSSGLGSIVALMKLLGPERPLDLACLNPTVDRVFRLTRMDGVFAILPTLEVATDAARQSA